MNILGRGQSRQIFMEEAIPHLGAIYRMALKNSRNPVLAGIKINLVNQGSLVIASLESSRHFIYITGDGLNRNEIVDLTKSLLEPLKRSLFASTTGSI